MGGQVLSIWLLVKNRKTCIKVDWFEIKTVPDSKEYMGDVDVPVCFQEGRALFFMRGLLLGEEMFDFYVDSHG